MTTSEMNQGYTIRPMRSDEADLVAELIFESTNQWYETHGYSSIFPGSWEDCRVFTDVYEDLDKGCCLIAVSDEGTILGSCFYHPRATHVSLGIMNTHPAFGRKGVAKALLGAIIEISKGLNLPLRLVSSAFNLDSFSLYTRQGFVPFSMYQDLIIKVPKRGLVVKQVPGVTLRSATPDDVEAIDTLERKVWKTSRKKDWAYFIKNKRKIWHVTVAETETGVLAGCLASVGHPGSNMLGPGLALEGEVTTALIQAELNQHKGKSPVFLVPVNKKQLVASLYDIGARNCELHFGQVLGSAPAVNGIVMPTFMPETA